MRVIAHLREKNLAKDFESAYLEKVVSAKSQRHYLLFNHPDILKSTKSKYTSFKDYQISLCVTSIARILRSKARQDRLEDYPTAVVHRLQNADFLLRKFLDNRYSRDLVSGAFKDSHSLEFELRARATGDGRRGCHLSLQHRDNYLDMGYRERRVDFEQVVSPNEFNLIYLGGLRQLENQVHYCESLGAIVYDGSGYFDHIV